MKSWYERFGFSKPTGGLFDGEAEGNIAWSNELQQNVDSGNLQLLRRYK